MVEIKYKCHTLKLRNSESKWYYEIQRRVAITKNQNACNLNIRYKKLT